jgi:CubicO group peptidase (beta-lactamase class C family)
MPHRLALVFAAALLASACAPETPPPKTAAPAFAASASRFTPGRAHPERRAKLAALAPRLDEHLRAKLAEARATGLAAGIILEGELVYERGFGVRDVRSNAPVDADSVFRIASLTKSFAAAAVLQLRDEGKVVLDAPAATYLPELGALAAPTRDAPPMTVRHLLTMASGLPYDDMWGPVTFGLGDDELARLVRSGVTLATAPGERYAYSNLGYAFLGKIVERVSGVRFRAYVTANLLQPLGMRGAVWESGDVAAGRLVVGYRREGDRLAEEPRPSDGVFDAAGGLYTSLRDYARYAAFQLAAYPPRDDPESGPLRRSTLREMHDGQRWSLWRGEGVPVVARSADGKLSLSAASYGFGWLNNTTCVREGFVQHGGFEPGYWSTVHLLPKHGIGVVVFSATGAVGWRSLEGTLAILREGGVIAPPTERPVAPALLQARETMSRLLEAWDPAVVARSYDEQSLRYAWHANLREELAALSRAHGRCQPDGPLRPYSRSHGAWRLRCERGAIEFTTFLTPSDPPRIQSSQWKEEFPPDDRAREAARRLSSLVGRSLDGAPQDLFDPTLDAGRARRSLARLSSQRSACELERPLSSDGQGRSTFLLRCSEGPLELWVRLHDKSGKVTDIGGGVPRDEEGMCAD